MFFLLVIIRTNLLNTVLHFTLLLCRAIQLLARESNHDFERGLEALPDRPDV